jgi:hypothetical protein
VFLQVFQKHISSVSFVFTYIASVVFECFKSRLSVTHVAMCMRSEGDTNTCCNVHEKRRGRERSLRVVWRRWRRPGGTGPAWARETQAQTGACRFFLCERRRELLVRARETAA